MSEALNRATRSITEADLPRMVLDLRELPAEFQDFHPTHDGSPGQCHDGGAGFFGQ